MCVYVYRFCLMSFNNLNLDKDEGLGDAQKSLAARNCGIAQNHSVIILCKLRKERYLPTISTQLHNTALFCTHLSILTFKVTTRLRRLIIIGSFCLCLVNSLFYSN